MTTPPDFTYVGAYDPTRAYFGTTWDGTTLRDTGADEVSYQGALWICNYYTIDYNPITDLPGDNGHWKLAPGSTPVYDQVAPEEVTGLKAGYTSQTSISLFWDAGVVNGVGNIGSYDIYDFGVKVGETTGTSFVVKNLALGSHHEYTVDAVDFSGHSLISDKLMAQTDTAEIASGKYFSPFVDLTLPSTNILELAKDSGLKDFTLAFMQGAGLNNDTGNLDSGIPTVSLGGASRLTLSSGTIIDQVHQVEAEGGTITVSFGGYTGRDPAVVAEQYSQNLQNGGDPMPKAEADAKAIAVLQSEYQSVMDTYGVTHLDFDIEQDFFIKRDANGNPIDDGTGHQVLIAYDNPNGAGGVVDDFVANGMRDQAVVGLQAANPNMVVSYTVAVSASGLPANYKAMLLDARDAGVHMNVLNIMAMDFGDGTTDMLAGAKSAAIATHAWLVANGMGDVKVGVTPMIGQNDISDEIFTSQNAKDLEGWARAQSWVAGMGMWELPRDRASSVEHLHQEASGTYSGLIQDDFQFSHIFDNLMTLSTQGADDVSGDELANRLMGLDGNDAINGQAGNDALFGNGGIDTLRGGLGADTLTGGGSKDVFVFARTVESNAAGPDVITDLNPKDRITLSGIDANTIAGGDQAFHLGGAAFTHSAGELIRFYDSGTNKTWFEGDTNGDGVADLVIVANGDHHTFNHFAL